MSKFIPKKAKGTKVPPKFKRSREVAPKGFKKTFKRLTDAKETEGEAYDWSHLQERVKISRRIFVNEYIKDFDAGAAFLRMGKVYENPTSRAWDWFQEPYVQWLLEKTLAKMDEEALITRQQVISGLKREANYRGPDSSASARVSALKNLARILGMEKTVTEGNLTLTGGGVMMIPATATDDDWEKKAAKEQAKLKSKVKGQ